MAAHMYLTAVESSLLRSVATGEPAQTDSQKECIQHQITEANLPADVMHHISMLVVVSHSV